MGWQSYSMQSSGDSQSSPASTDERHKSFDPFIDDLPIAEQLNTDLSKFVSKQKVEHVLVLDEMRAGYKDDHWIWYIMPQEQLSSRNEYRLNLKLAKQYMHFEKDGVHLGRNYLEIMTAVREQLFVNKRQPW